ncbi:MAG: hypothetical protein JO039_24370 [Solirubrobacterales bacterium]|nr:hypothetical protein [Solirubrobacterales bacterium]
MNDDWRLRVHMHEDGRARALTEQLDATELEHDLENTFHDRVVVSVDGAEVFCYTGTREQAERAREAIASIAAKHGWQPDYELRHWHPTAEEWEDPDAPLPADAAGQAAEHAELMEQEREESIEQGFPDFEVRVTCSSHRETVELAHTLRAEGLPCVQRWKYLLVGVANEDDANALAARLRDEAPAGCTVTAEGNLRDVYDERPFSPFSFLGGLGG